MRASAKLSVERRKSSNLLNVSMFYFKNGPRYMVTNIRLNVR